MAIYLMTYPEINALPKTGLRSGGCSKENEMLETA
jgi:hypothetical protein